MDNRLQTRRSFYPTLHKNIKITGEYRKFLAGRMLADYREGVSIRTLAEATGRSYGFVHRLLKESGADFRTRGGYNRKRVVESEVTEIR